MIILKILGCLFIAAVLLLLAFAAWVTVVLLLHPENMDEL